MASGKYFRLGLWLLLLIVLQLGAQPSRYYWPTNASKLMSSSFCEFRPRHYHAAIDIKTWNRTGYKVFAVEDGYVMRVRVSAYGYGRAIYLKLKDGNIAVYGHLERFRKDLEEYVRRYRLKHQQYRVDLYFDPKQFPVKRGDYIARTGKTGIGVPHLHFELRNSRNEPINPLPYYHNVIQDNIPPRLFQLVFLPLQGDAFINLKPDTLFVDLNGASQVTLPDTFYISGTVGLALKVYDWANGARNRFSFYRAELQVDSNTVYSVQYDRFSYGTTRFVELDKNFSLWRRHLGIYHNFFRHPANSLDMYGDTPPNGGILSPATLSPGLHTAHIHIEDYWGNAADLQFHFLYGTPAWLQHDFFRRDSSEMFLRLQSPQPLQEVQAYFRKNERWYPDTSLQVTGHLFREHLHHYALFLNPLFPEEQCPLKILGRDTTGFPTWPLYLNCSARGDTATSADSPPFHCSIRKNWVVVRFDPSQFPLPPILEKPEAPFPGMVRFPLSPHLTEIHIPVSRVLENRDLFSRIFPCSFPRMAYYRPGHSLLLRSQDGRFSARFSPGSLYDSTAIMLRTLPPDSLSPSDFRCLTPIYDVEPFDVPVDQGVQISLRVPEGLWHRDRLALFYRTHGESDWSFLPAQWDSLTHQFSARVTSLEQFTLGRDTIPPLLLPAQRVHRDTLFSRKGYLTFVVKDEQTGIGAESHINVWVNGRWHLFVYDPEEDRLTVHIPSPAKGEIHLTIEVQDNVGNRTVKRFLVK